MKWKNLFNKNHTFKASPTSSPNTQDMTNQQPENNMSISQNLADNLKRIEDILANCSDAHIIHWKYGPELAHTAFSVYFDSLIQKKAMNFMKETMQDLVTHQVGPATMITPEDVMSFFGQQGVSAQSHNLLENFDQVVHDIVNGSLVIFFNHWNKAISYKAIGLETRQVTEPINEPVVQGPHMSTIENLSMNIGLIRNSLKSVNLKFVTLTAGTELQNKIAFGYLEGAVNPETLAEFKERIGRLDKEEILETSYIEEWLEDDIYTPFPQVRFTERPDTAAASLLDGKIIVMVDGTPTILICPGLFVEFFGSSEDYYHKTVYSSLIRFIRLITFFMALTLPSIYIALSTFHPELIPTVLLLAILDTREGIPFPAFLEALLMEFFFEVLREAGIRLPRPVGSAVSIVGALVIGQAAIQAKIASPMMVIIVSLTGIASFSLPQYNFAITLRILRFPLMIVAASLGGFGLMIAFLLILLHLTMLRCLGQPYLAPLAPLRITQLRDVFIRVPLKILLRSPRNRHLHKTPRNE